MNIKSKIDLRNQFQDETGAEKIEPAEYLEWLESFVDGKVIISPSANVKLNSFTKHLTPDELEYHGGLTVLTKEELEQREREAWDAAREEMISRNDRSSIVQKYKCFDHWQSTRDNSRGKEEK